MTYIAKPRLHHPLLKPNGLGFTRRDYEGKVSTLVRRLRTRFDIGGHHPGLLRSRPAAAPARQAFGHRLLVEDA